MSEPTDQELVDMAAASTHRDLIRQAIRSGEQEGSDSRPVLNSEQIEQQVEQDGRVSLLSKEVSEHRRWLEEQGIYLSPCYWIRSEPDPVQVTGSAPAELDAKSPAFTATT